MCQTVGNPRKGIHCWMHDRINIGDEFKGWERILEGGIIDVRENKKTLEMSLPHHH